MNKPLIVLRILGTLLIVAAWYAFFYFGNTHRATFE